LKSETIASIKAIWTATTEAGEVCKFETSMVAIFGPIVAGEECKTEEENKFCISTIGAEEASKAYGEEKVCTGG
jgi:hypothetical protein